MPPGATEGRCELPVHVGGVFGVAAPKRPRCFGVRSGETMDGIRWAGELGTLGRWKGPMTPGMAERKANPKQICRPSRPFLTSLKRRKPLIRQGAPPPASPSSEFRFQFPQGSVGSSPIIRTSPFNG